MLGLLLLFIFVGDVSVGDNFPSKNDSLREIQNHNISDKKKQISDLERIEKNTLIDNSKTISEKEEKEYIGIHDIGENSYTDLISILKRWNIPYIVNNKNVFVKKEYYDKVYKKALYMFFISNGKRSSISKFSEDTKELPIEIEDYKDNPFLNKKQQTDAWLRGDRKRVFLNIPVFKSGIEDRALSIPDLYEISVTIADHEIIITSISPKDFQWTNANKRRIFEYCDDAIKKLNPPQNMQVEFKNQKE